MSYPPEQEVTDIERILKEMSAGRFVCCYLLWGEEEFQLKEALDKILAIAVPPEDRDFLFFPLDGARASVGSIMAALQASPLIPGRKIVLVTDTILFQSKDTLPATIDRIRARLAENPGKAAEDFAQILPQTGYQLEDLAAGAWQGLSEEEGCKLMSPEAWQERENWLPALLEICRTRRLTSSLHTDDTQELTDLLARGLPEAVHLILTAPAVDRRKRLYKVISEVGRISYFPKAKRPGKQLQAVMEMGRGILAAAGKEMATPAWEKLGARVMFDLQAARAALEKLLNYRTEKIITEQDVEAVVGDHSEPGLFDLMAATWEKKVARALIILAQLLRRINHIQILSFFAREVRLMLQAGEILERPGIKYRPDMDYARFQAEVYPAIKAGASPSAKAAGLLAGQHPFVIFNCLKNAARRRRAELLVLQETLAEIDLTLKTSSQDPALLLEMFIIKAACGDARRSQVADR